MNINSTMNKVASDFYKEHSYTEGSFKGRLHIAKVMSTCNLIGLTSAAAQTALSVDGKFFQNAQANLKDAGSSAVLLILFSYAMNELLQETIAYFTPEENVMEESLKVAAKPVVHKEKCQAVCLIALTALGIYGWRYHSLPSGDIFRFSLSGISLGSAVSYVANALLSDTPSKNLAIPERKKS